MEVAVATDCGAIWAACFRYALQAASSLGTSDITQQCWPPTDLGQAGGELPANCRPPGARSGAISAIIASACAPCDSGA